MKQSILVWENDIGWCEQIQRALIAENFLVREADGRELQQLCRSEGCIALVLSLEQLLEEFGESAWKQELCDICQRVRQPVLVLSGMEENCYELAALQAGAADYVLRQKGIAILLARLKKSVGAAAERMRSNTDYPDIYEMLSDREIQIAQKRISLTQKEAQVFHCLLHAKGEVVSRETILRQGWGEEVPECKRVVDTVIKQLRGKIKETQYVIHSKYKLGYFLEKR